MRNKKRLLAVFATTMAMVVSMGSCAQINKAIYWLTTLIEGPLTDEPLVGEVIADFKEGKADTFFESSGWTNDGPFNTWWTEDRVAYENETLKLSLADNPDGTVAGHDEYFGGEARSHQYFGYGDFEVMMKPSNVKGTASTFFTCTGPYDTDTEGNPNPHDEIDIEFLGSDTTKVQFNYFVNGKGGHEFMYDLGFDASEEFHEYGYRWTKDYIVWFVDDVPVYKVRASKNNPLPATPGRMLMSYWVGSKEAEGWMGKFDGNYDATTEYKWVRTSAAPIGELPPPSEDVVIPEGEKSALTFDGQGDYILDQEGAAESVTATYTDIAGNTYKNIKASVAELAADKDTFSITLKNNGETPVKARVDLQGSTLVSTGASSQTDACNVSASATGGSDVRTDTTWGGSFVTLGGNETVTLIIRYDNSLTQGPVQNLLVYLDSSTNEPSTSSGNVTLSDFIFTNSKGGETTPPDGGEDLPPVETEGKAEFDLSACVFEGNVADGYAITQDTANKTLTMAYTDMRGDCYKNINTPIASVAGARNVFNVTVKNNGANAVTLRIDINSEEKRQETIACNLSATQDGVGVYTDTTWGGSTFTIEAGATAVLEIKYDPSRKPTNLMIYADSSLYGNSSLFSGSITLSAASFATAESVPPSEDGDKPAAPSKVVISSITNGDEKAAVATPGSFLEWHDQNWCGSNVTVSKAEAVDGAAHISYSGATTACWFGMQLFFENPGHVDGKTYKVTLDVTSAAAGDITINGQIFTLAVGANHFEVVYTETPASGDVAGASLSIQMGTYTGSVIAENELIISNITFTEAA